VSTGHGRVSYAGVYFKCETHPVKAWPFFHVIDVIIRHYTGEHAEDVIVICRQRLFIAVT